MNTAFGFSIQKIADVLENKFKLGHCKKENSIADENTIKNLIFHSQKQEK